MTWTWLALWWLAGLTAVAGSSLFSGLETGLYSLSRIRLHTLAESGNMRARIIQSLLHDPRTMLTTLLVSNNIANYTATSALGVILGAAGYSDWQVIGLNLLIMNGVLFVLGEVLPKDLFAAHADRLVYPFARLLDGLRRFCRYSGLLALITAVSDLVFWATGSKNTATLSPPRQVVGLLLREAIEPGLVSDEQSAMAERVLELGGRTIGQEMTPWAKVVKVGLDDAPAMLWDLAGRPGPTRLPVVNKAGQPVGMVSLYEVLMHDRDACPPMDRLMEPPILMDRSTPLRQALSRLQTSHLALAIVTDRGRPVGVVSVKDLLEPITGELSTW